MTGIKAQGGLLCLLLMFCILILILNMIHSDISSYITVHFVKTSRICTLEIFLTASMCVIPKLKSLKENAPSTAVRPHKNPQWRDHNPAKVQADKQCWPPDVWVEMSRWFQTSALFKVFLLCPAQICDPQKPQEMIKWLSWDGCFATKRNCRNIN